MMRSCGRRVVWIKLLSGMLLLVLMMGCTTVFAGENKEGIAKEAQEKYTEKFIDELGLDELGNAFEDSVSPGLDYKELVKELADNGISLQSIRGVAGKVVSYFIGEFEDQRKTFISLLSVAVLFTLFNRVLMVKKTYISDISFLMIYASMMTLLLKNFLVIGETVTGCIRHMISFLSSFIPAYAAALFLSGNMTSAGMFYEFTFALMYIIEWGISIFILPAIHVFVLLEFLNNVFVEERLSKLAGLIEKIIRFFLKVSIALVMGMSMIQSLIAPAKDRVSESIFVKGVSFIPGLGKTVGATGEILISCGMLIKNSVGVVALIVLVAITFVPAVKILLFNLMYYLLAAVLQPVSDKRIVNAIGKIALGGELYFKVLMDTTILFFIVIAIVSSTTSSVF